MYSAGCHAFCRALTNHQIRLRASHDRVVRVARARGRLEIPEHPTFACTPLMR